MEGEYQGKPSCFIGMVDYFRPALNMSINIAVLILLTSHHDVSG